MKFAEKWVAVYRRHVLEIRESVAMKMSGIYIYHFILYEEIVMAKSYRIERIEAPSATSLARAISARFSLAADVRSFRHDAKAVAYSRSPSVWNNPRMKPCWRYVIRPLMAYQCTCVFLGHAASHQAHEAKSKLPPASSSSPAYAEISSIIFYLSAFLMHSLFRLMPMLLCRALISSLKCRIFILLYLKFTNTARLYISNYRISLTGAWYIIIIHRVDFYLQS